MSSPVSGLTQPNSSSSTSGTTAQPLADPLTQETTFLQLMVTELRNQDPSQPTDGTQFLTQLAQFTQLEETSNVASSVSDIDSLMQQLVNGTTGSAAGNTAPTN